MPTSKKQIKSNRKNARQSNGPKTLEGKNAVRHNAVKHGIYSNDLVIQSSKLTEDPAELEELIQSLKNEYQPIGVMQEHYVIDIAKNIWRLRRVAAAETARINRQMDSYNINVADRNLKKQIEQSDTLGDEMVKLAEKYLSDEVGMAMVPKDNFARDLLYYEMRLNRGLTRSLKMLLVLQMRDIQESLEREKQTKELVAIKDE